MVTPSCASALPGLPGVHQVKRGSNCWCSSQSMNTPPSQVSLESGGNPPNAPKWRRPNWYAYVVCFFQLLHVQSFRGCKDQGFCRHTPQEFQYRTSHLTGSQPNCRTKMGRASSCKPQQPQRTFRGGLGAAEADGKWPRSVGGPHPRYGVKQLDDHKRLRCTALECRLRGRAWESSRVSLCEGTLFWGFCYLSDGPLEYLKGPRCPVEGQAEASFG